MFPGKHGVVPRLPCAGARVGGCGFDPLLVPCFEPAWEGAAGVGVVEVRQSYDSEEETYDFNVDGANEVVRRYSMFYPLYPIGIGAEWWLMYRSIEPVGKISTVLAGFFYFLLALYVPGECALYSRIILCG